MPKYNCSPLRYPGGKNQLSDYVGRLINEKNLNNSTYIEPFCGGAAVALNLLVNGIVKDIIINDFDRSIYAFWFSVKHHSEELCRMIQNIDVTISEWHRQKEIQDNKNYESLLTLGFSTLFLNRTNRSGIIKAGVIGGLSQDGDYKLDCRFNKKQIIEKIKTIAVYSDRITLYNMDTIEFIDSVIDNLNKKSFIFFDPPYYKKGKSLYTNFYNHNDHVALANKIKSIKYHSWIVTYDNINKISEMYKGVRNEVYGLNYIAQNRYRGEELIFYSKTLSTPNIKNIKILDYI